MKNGVLGSWIASAVLAALLALTADAAQHRSSSAKRAFVAANPCPSTGRPRLPCPGYVIDHHIPLCAGGADHPSNMQWQTVAAAKVKDRAEVAQCRRR